MILRTLGLRKGGIEVVSCPTCGRTQIDLIGLANRVRKSCGRLSFGYQGCRHGLCGQRTGPRAEEADLGVAGGHWRRPFDQTWSGSQENAGRRITPGIKIRIRSLGRVAP